VEWAHDYGGLFSPGLVVIGARDVREIAEGFVDRRFERIPPHLLEWYWRLGLRVVSRSQLVHEVTPTVTCALAVHEFGHAMDHEAGSHLLGVAAERRADYLGGILSERLGWQDEREQWIFDEIGCRGPAASCQHARPETRRADFNAGRAAASAERVRMQEEFRRLLLSASLLSRGLRSLPSW
jgi:hypothetical protein